MIVVTVLMASCQVSEKLKNGPAHSQAPNTTVAETKAAGEPRRVETAVANFLKKSCSMLWYSEYT